MPKQPAQTAPIDETEEALKKVDATLDTLEIQLNDLRTLRHNTGMGVQQREERLHNIVNRPPNLMAPTQNVAVGRR